MLLLAVKVANKIAGNFSVCSDVSKLISYRFLYSSCSLLQRDAIEGRRHAPSAKSKLLVLFTGKGCGNHHTEQEPNIEVANNIHRLDR